MTMLNLTSKMNNMEQSIDLMKSQHMTLQNQVQMQEQMSQNRALLDQSNMELNQTLSQAQSILPTQSNEDRELEALKQLQSQINS